MIYDTLRLAKALRVSFTPEQSEALAQAFSESTETASPPSSILPS